MNKHQTKEVATMVGNIARKVAESAVHAAVFAYVSKKVANFMTKQEDKAKIRVEESKTSNSKTS